MTLKKIRGTLIFVLSVLSVLAFDPYIFYTFLSSWIYKIIYLLSFAIVIFFLLWHRNIKLPPLKFCLVIGIQFVAWTIYSAVHLDTAYWSRCFYLAFTFLVFLALYNFSDIHSFVKVNVILVTIQAAMAAIAFFLVLSGILEPLFEYSNLDGRTGYCYGLTCSNFVLGNIIRAAGYFDEPGALAFWGVYSLIINKMFIKNRVIEITLIIGLIFTLSMAYFIQLALYLLFFYSKKPQVIIPICLLLVTGGIIVAGQGRDSEIYTLTIRRFERGSSGKIESSRDDLTHMAKEQFKVHPILGTGVKEMEKLPYMADNPFETLATDGIVGTFIIYLPLLFVLADKKSFSKEMFISVMILMAGYLQRPFHVRLIHYIFLFSFCYLALSQKNKQSS
ncbi:MAG: hypothetical protein MJY69_01035 [Bacteroidales bacterium]|nr:hypothetical protein [Bacteroidales bacterium]